MLKIISAALLALMLSGCVLVRSNVSVFHELDPAQPRLFAIAPMKEQEGSLEWKSYADRIKVQLTQKGYREAPVDVAELVVFFTYGVDSGKQVVGSYPIMGQTGVSSSYTSGSVMMVGNTGYVSGTTYNTPRYGVVGTGVTSQTKYGRYLKVEMLDRKSLAAGQLKKVYEAEVKSEGSSNQIAAVMPSMIKSLFEEFPGQSGSTRRSTIPQEQ